MAAGCLLLQLLGIADLFVTLPAVQFFIVVGALLFLASLVRESICFHNREALHLLLPMGVLLVAGLFEIWTFYFGRVVMMSGSTRIGMMLFILMLGMGSVQKLLDLLNKNREARYFQKLAYQDLLTGCRNRTAYHEEVQRLFGCAQSPVSRWLVLLDVNCLKQINDLHGHSSGDDSLRRTADCMRRAFSAQGRMYRIGGDEFAILLCGVEESRVEEWMQAFFAQVDKEDALVEYKLQVAAGFGRYDSRKHQNFEELFQEIDRRMYQNKLRLKDD